MSLQDSFENLNDTCTLIEGIYVDWTLRGVGFGQLTFYRLGHKTIFDCEGRSKEDVKRILNALVDSSEEYSPALHDPIIENEMKKLKDIEEAYRAREKGKIVNGPAPSGS